MQLQLEACVVLVLAGVLGRLPAASAINARLLRWTPLNDGTDTPLSQLLDKSDIRYGSDCSGSTLGSGQCCDSSTGFYCFRFRADAPYGSYAVCMTYGACYTSNGNQDEGDWQCTNISMCDPAAIADASTAPDGLSSSNATEASSSGNSTEHSLPLKASKKRRARRDPSTDGAGQGMGLPRFNGTRQGAGSLHFNGTGQGSGSFPFNGTGQGAGSLPFNGTNQGAGSLPSNQTMDGALPLNQTLVGNGTLANATASVNQTTQGNAPTPMPIRCGVQPQPSFPTYPSMGDVMDVRFDRLCSPSACCDSSKGLWCVRYSTKGHPESYTTCMTYGACYQSNGMSDSGMWNCNGLSRCGD